MSRQRSWHRKRAENIHYGQHRADQGRSQNTQGSRGTCRRRRKSEGSSRDQEQRRHTCLSIRKAVGRAGREDFRRQEEASRRRHCRGARRDQSQRRRRNEADLRRVAEQVPGSQRRPLQASVSRRPVRVQDGPGTRSAPRGGAEEGAGRKRAKATLSMRSSKSWTTTRRNNENNLPVAPEIFGGGRHNNKPKE